MTTTELSELIVTKLGVHAYGDGMTNVLRFHYQGNSYRVTTNLLVEKVDGACLVSDSDAQQLEKLLRGEQWDGTGLPPVGTECEYSLPPAEADSLGSAWKRCFIRYSSKLTVVIQTHNSELSGHPSKFDFRPLRTEREKAVEQMIEFHRNTLGSYDDSMRQLYDAIVAGKIDGLGKMG